jgi:hypothetical protein
MQLSIGGLIGFASVWPIAHSIKANQLTNPLIYFGLIMSGYLLAFVLGVAMHELGHILAGLRAGFRFAYMMFWPVQIRRKGERSLSIRPMFKSGLGLGGIAGMAPISGLDLRKAYLTMLWGGPLASLLWGAVAISISLLAGLTSSIVGSYFWLMGIISLFVFMISIIPRSVAGYLTDGAAIKLLSRGKAEQVEIYVASLELSSEVASGKRPSECNSFSLNTLLRAEPDDQMFARGRYFGFLTAADSGDLEKARSYMNELMSGLNKTPVLVRASYQIMDAWLHAREGKTEEARRLLKLSQGGLVEKCDQVMVEAVILAAEGKHEEASNLARTVPELITGSMIPDAYAFTRFQVEGLIR